MENSIKFNIPVRSIYALIASVIMVWVTYITLKELSTLFDSFLEKKFDHPITQSDILYLWYPIIAYICICVSIFSIASVFKKITIYPFFPLNFKKKVNGLTDSFALLMLYSLVGAAGSFILFGILSLTKFGLSIIAFRTAISGLVLGFSAFLVFGDIIIIFLGLFIEFTRKNEK